MPQAPESAGRKAAAYWFIDGFQDMITGGAFFLLGAVMIWYGWYRPQRPDLWLKVLVAAAMVVLLLALFVWDRRIALFLKSRVTFSRTGYARPPVMLGGGYEPPMTLGLTPYKAPPDENVTAFRMASRAVLILGWWLADGIARPAGIPAILALVALLLYLLNRNSERPYPWAWLLVLPVAGLAAMLFDPPRGDVDGRIVMAVEGGWLAAYGAWELRRYLQVHPQDPRPAESFER